MPAEGSDSVTPTTRSFFSRGTMEMPPGVPVATVSIGKAGATNAGVLAAQMLALADKAIAERLQKYKKNLADKVENAARQLEKH